MRVRVAAVLLLLVGAGAVEAQKRAITEKDLFDFHWIGDAQLSPDGAKAVFVEATVNAKREGYDTALYLLDVEKPGSEPRRLTNGPRDTQPRWSPDGKQIAFVRAGEKDGKPQPGQLMLLSLGGGEPQPLPAIEKGSKGPAWSPDGKYLAVLGETPIVPAPKKADGEKKEPEHVSDVRVITKSVYRSNGSGYLDGKDAAQIYVYAMRGEGQPVKAARALTAGKYGVEEFVWGCGSDKLYYTVARVDDASYECRTMSSTPWL